MAKKENKERIQINDSLTILITTVMNYKKILLIIFAIIWTIGVMAQQIYWVSMGSYNTATFIWTIMELSFPYLIFKALED